MAQGKQIYHNTCQEIRSQLVFGFLWDFVDKRKITDYHQTDSLSQYMQLQTAASAGEVRVETCS